MREIHKQVDVNFWGYVNNTGHKSTMQTGLLIKTSTNMQQEGVNKQTMPHLVKNVIQVGAGWRRYSIIITMVSFYY